MKLLFWFALGWLAYVYVGYPLLLALLAALRKAPDLRPAAAGEELPVTLVVSAYNEERVIREKLDNALALDYPAGQFEVMVVSDACSDRTDEIVQSFGDPRVRLLRMAQRGGKTAGLNAAVQAARGTIIVFSDANAMYERGSIRALVGPFRDPRVGAVTGEQRYHAAEGGSAGEGEGLYWKYELAIKRRESTVSSVIGGDGAIYAIRRELYWPMRPEDVSDFVNPLQIVAAGHRNVYQPAAAAYEHSGDSDLKEFRRKVRIVNQSWSAAWKLGGLLNPFRHGAVAWQLWSHKILRWLALVPLALLFAASVALRGEGGIYSLLFWAQSACYALALMGWAWRDERTRPRLASIPYYFMLVNVASIRGLIEHYQGKTYATWATVRENGG
jgi:glycosyltransferase involved in cell wall biosynthesis